MKGGESLSVWLSSEDRRRLEEACAVAGYSHLSRYVRDKALDRLDAYSRVGSGLGRRDLWRLDNSDADLAELSRSHRTMKLMLAMLLGLARQRATASDINALAAAAARTTEEDALDAFAPELAAVMRALVWD